MNPVINYFPTIGDVAAQPAANTVLGRLKDINDNLSNMASSSSPVVVSANLKSGLGAYSNLGAPNVAADGQVAYSNNFVPNGEKVSIQLGYYQTGTAAINFAGGGAFWLEADLSGGTTFSAVQGSKVTFASLDRPTTSNNLILQLATRAFGNWRLGIAFGTRNVSGGSTGAIGFNLSLLN